MKQEKEAIDEEPSPNLGDVRSVLRCTGLKDGKLTGMVCIQVYEYHPTRYLGSSQPAWYDVAHIPVETDVKGLMVEQAEPELRFAAIGAVVKTLGDPLREHEVE